MRESSRIRLRASRTRQRRRSRQVGRGVGGALVQAYEVAERHVEPSVERRRRLICRQHGNM
eukprot:2958309-Prymnesium_polylepis.1